MFPRIYSDNAKMSETFLCEKLEITKARLILRVLQKISAPLHAGGPSPLKFKIGHDSKSKRDSAAHSPTSVHRTTDAKSNQELQSG